jgi:hypothetical protein
MASETKVFFKLEKPSKEKVFSGSSKRVRVSGEEDEYRSYEEHNIGMWANQDGAIGLTDWNGEGMIYLYPDQLEHLQKVLEVALSQRSLTKRVPDAGDSAASQEVPPQSGDPSPEVNPAATQRR